VADALGVLADVHRTAGDLETARDLAQRALAILDDAALHTPETVHHLERLASLEHALGQEAAARAHHARALEIAETLFGANHDTVILLRAKGTGDLE
jgi:hypothetical protein